MAFFRWSCLICIGILLSSYLIHFFCHTCRPSHSQDQSHWNKRKKACESKSIDLSRKEMMEKRKLGNGWGQGFVSGLTLTGSVPEFFFTGSGSRIETPLSWKFVIYFMKTFFIRNPNPNPGKNWIQIPDQFVISLWRFFIRNGYLFSHNISFFPKK